ncbi:MAG: arylsulfatase [Verrucomicrobia bacterium]|nr:arylsulfatase [Verrucomicrobiota bacterium]
MPASFHGFVSGLRGSGRAARRVGSLAVLGLLAPAVDLAAAAPDRPNIVLIVADDLGYGDLGCYGATRVRTPHVDRLAAGGVRFTQGYAPSSTCTPTRYALMTGEYGWRQPEKKTAILDGDAPLCIDPGRPTLPRALQEAGYRTGAVGKWHLGLGDGRAAVDFNGRIQPGPREIGFDYSHIIPATVDRVPSVWIENDRVVGLDPADPIAVSYQKDFGIEPNGVDRPDLLKVGADRQHSGTIVHGVSRIGYMKGGKAARFKDADLPATVIRKSVEFLEASRTRPFFLYVGLFEPHVPRVAAAPFAGASALGIRGDVIEQMDWITGEILQALERLKLAEHTLVIFTSDNGPVLFDGYHDRAQEDTKDHRPAGGLRGWKYLVYEGGCRVPLIARWPARIRPRVSDQMFNLVDLYATLARLTGSKFSPDTAPDSLDLSRVLLGQTTDNLRGDTVLHGIANTLSLRAGDWKYVPATASGLASGIGSGANPRDTRFAESRIPEPLLFNLRTDPAETRNVIREYPEKAVELRQRLDTLTARRGHAAAP